MSEIIDYFKDYEKKGQKKKRKFSNELPYGRDETVQDFFANCISTTIIDKDYILGWHNMLVDYIKRPDSVFLVRYYENGTKKSGRWNTRRSAQTKFDDGFTYVYASNFEAHEIFNMASKGIVPTVDEFTSLLVDRRYGMHYDNGKSKSCEEYDISAYPHIGSVRAGVLTECKWYLAHLYGIKELYINYDISNRREEIFPRGKLEDWNNKEGYPVRHIQKSLTLNEKNIVKAHFLRFIDPLNYFLTPGNKYFKTEIDWNDNKNIGEKKELVEYIKEKYNQVYGDDVMKEFRNLALIPENSECSFDYGKHIIKIEYGANFKKL